MHPIEMHERQAAVVRTAIESTLNHLDSLHETSVALTLLVEHLGVLLNMEKEMLAVVLHDDNVVQGLQDDERKRIAALWASFCANRDALVTTATEPEKPWYPDDSGQWVESHGVDPELSDRLRVCVLGRSARGSKSYSYMATAPSNVVWPNIVAYKVVSS